MTGKVENLKDTDYLHGCFLRLFVIRRQVKLDNPGTSKPLWIEVHGAVLSEQHKLS